MLLKNHEPEIALIRDWKQSDKVGKITVNTFKGGISSVKVEQTYKPEEIEAVILREEFSRCFSMDEIKEHLRKRQ